MRAPRERAAPGAPRAAAGVAITQREFELLRDLIYREAGILLGAHKMPLLVNRLAGRLRELGIESFGVYYDLVRQERGEELVVLLDRVTTNETHFFREPRHFEFLVEHVLPSWTAEAALGRRSRVVRVWSAACSTGEEPYSLAMTLRSHLPPSEGWDVRILATDLSTAALATARAAIWPIERTEGSPRRYLQQFMLRGKRTQSGKVRAGPEIRSMVRFDRLNLNDAAYGEVGEFDLILCRNALIYFNAESKARVVSRLLRHLAPDGYFFLGHAETLHGVTDAVRSVIPTVYTRADQTAGARISPRQLVPATRPSP